MSPTEPMGISEASLLLGWLEFHRDALFRKCGGLSDEDLVQASSPPSDMSLLGLVRHLTEMERVYVVHALEGGQLDLVYCSDEHPDADFEGLSAGMAEASLVRWHQERTAADRLLQAADSLDDQCPGNGYTLRWNLLKVIQEYARHNGHADLIRERIDGTTGE